MAVAADYDADGETRCDVRIYCWDGTDYLPDSPLMVAFNELPRSGNDFPVEELHRLGPAKALVQGAEDWETAYRQVLLPQKK